MNSRLDELLFMSKKKKKGFREAVGAQFSSFFLFHSLYFSYACFVGDALRKLKDKKLRKSNQIKKLFSIIVATIGVAWLLNIFTI